MKDKQVSINTPIDQVSLLVRLRELRRDLSACPADNRGHIRQQIADLLLRHLGTIDNALSR